MPSPFCIIHNSVLLRLFDSNAFFQLFGHITQKLIRWVWLMNSYIVTWLVWHDVHPNHYISTEANSDMLLRTCALTCHIYIFSMCIYHIDYFKIFLLMWLLRAYAPRDMVDALTEPNSNLCPLLKPKYNKSMFVTKQTLCFSTKY